VVEAEAGHVAIQLLPGAIYCAGGLECSPADFPVDFTWGDAVCPEACPECAALAVGDRGLFGVDLGTGCLERVLEVTAEGVACNEYEPVAFVLEHYLSPGCAEATRDAGYFEWCDDTLESCAACSHAGQGGGGLLVMVVGLGLARKRRK
jgi:MYXO-CTERM domain-containing protein